MEDAKALRSHADRTSADRAENIIAAAEIFASANEKAQAGNISESLHVALSSTTAQITSLARPLLPTLPHRPTLV